MLIRNLILSFLLISSAGATTISITDFTGTIDTVNQVVKSNGAGGFGTIPTGSALIRLGYFVTSEQSGTWAADLSSPEIGRINSAMASFVALGENFSTLPLLGDSNNLRFADRLTSTTPNGRLAGNIANVTPTGAAVNSRSTTGVPALSRIYMLVYSDLNSVLNSGEDFGVFSAENWLMPESNLSPLNLNTQDVNLASEIFRGSLGSLRLAPVGVPEPTTMTFGALAALGLLARRRR